jgi:hypothetical protein
MAAIIYLIGISPFMEFTMPVEETLSTKCRKQNIPENGEATFGLANQTINHTAIAF